MTLTELAAARVIHESYLRIREKLAPWGAHNTVHGGHDRFAKTEAALDVLLAENARLLEYFAALV